MKAIYTVLVMLVILAINNVVLLNLLGYFDNNDGAAAQPQQDITVDQRQLDSQPLSQEKTKRERENTPTNKPAENTVSQTESNTLDDSEMAEEFRRYTSSEEFSNIIDQHLLSYSSRSSNLQNKLSEMSAQELFQLFIESDDHLESEMAVLTLIQGKTGNLDTLQLKQLYQNPNVPAWGKSAMLTSLLVQGDDESFDWAKEFIRDGGTGAYYDTEMLTQVYEQDPEFIKRHIKGLNLNNNSTGVESMISFAATNPELSKYFLQNNLDKLLETNNNTLFNWMSHTDSKLELTNQQENSLASLFNSKNPNKRSFAINMVPNISDVDLLRNSYSDLSREEEKIQFLSSLLQTTHSQEHMNLAQELAVSSDNSDIRELVQ